MVPSGPSTPINGAQPVPPSLLRSNSSMLGGQGGSSSSQTAFQSLGPSRTQFSNVNMLGNVQNVPSLLHQSFGNASTNSGISGAGSTQRGLIDAGAESDPLLSGGNGTGFMSHTSSFAHSNMGNLSSSGQVQGQQFSNPSGNQMLQDQQQSIQLEPQNFQHNQQALQQFSNPLNNHQPQQQQQQQYQSTRGGLGGVGPVKLEPQVANDLQSLRNLGAVKLEPQQMQMRGLSSAKMETQQSEQSMLMLQQQQQQHQNQFLMSRQSSQAAAAAQMNQLQHQRFLQQQQQQHHLHHQQQLLKAMSGQRSPSQPQLQQQNTTLRSNAKLVYEPGTCARRLTRYMSEQQNRPADNNIEFWRDFVADHFAPGAKKRWCVSMYGSGRQTTGVFPQDLWYCEICNRKPGRGFEAAAEVLPRLFKIKYESGTLEELLYVDMPREYQNSSGQIVLDYAKAIQESIFDHLRVVRDGQLRIVFNADLKICSWEFCARRHEELIPRRLMIPQVSQLGQAAQKYQTVTQNVISAPELQNNCNMFVASARQLAKALEVPLVNDLGYTKRYVRCLQISEVVNSMKDLINYSRETGIGPIETLVTYPRRTNVTTFGVQSQLHQSEEQPPLPPKLLQTGAQISNSNSNIDLPNVNNSLLLHPGSTTTSSSGTAIVGLLHQNSMNPRQQQNHRMSNGNSFQIPSSPVGSSSTIMQQQQQQQAPFHSPLTPSSSNNLPQPAVSGDADPSNNESQSSVQKIIQEMIMSSQQLNGAGLGNNNDGTKSTINGMMPRPSNNNNNINMGGGLGGNNSGTGVAGFSTMVGGGGGGGMSNGLRGNNNNINNNMTMMNGRVPPVGSSMMMMMIDPDFNNNNNNNRQQQQQQDLGNNNQFLNGFNDLPFDWKPSP